MKLIRRTLFVGVIFELAGCVSTTPNLQTTTAHPSAIEMQPLVVRDQVDSLTGMDGYDADSLLERGNQFFDQGAFDKALQVFRTLLVSFPESSLRDAAHYNAGLCLEHLAEDQEALRQYSDLVRIFPNSTYIKDAYFRIGFLSAKAKVWQETETTFSLVLTRNDLLPMETLEARVALGVARFMSGRFQDSEQDFREALRFYEKESEHAYLPADYWVGQSRFYLGEIYARQFESLSLVSLEDKSKASTGAVGERLEEKCAILLRAQTSFIKAIRIGHAGWATAAGYRIGSMYETLYRELLAVPVPDELDDEATSVYQAELRERIRVLVTKAIRVYEQSLQMAQRVGADNQWVAQTEAALSRMKSLYLETLPG
jgi:tetratricopeptide (TPR) repeat protein